MIKLSLALLLTICSFNLFAKDNYIITEIKNSDKIGRIYKLQKPVAYIKNLSKCNNVSKEIAYNTSCFQLPNATAELTEISNNCVGCFRKSLMPEPLSLELKEEAELTVVSVYSVKQNRFTLGSAVGRYFLLKDQDQNLIEAPEYLMTSFGFLENKVSRETSKIMSAKKTAYIVKQICYYNRAYNDAKSQKIKIVEMLSDFDLTDTIKVSESVCNRRGMKTEAITLVTEDFNSFLTFNYFKKDWGIYGKMD